MAQMFSEPLQIARPLVRLRRTSAIGTDGSGTPAGITGTSGDDVLYGTSGPDTIDALAGNDVLEGLGDADILNGGADNDYLDGGTGADNMAGGTGNDIYWVDEAGDVVTEAAGEGQDNVFTRTSYVLAAGSEVEFMQIGVAGAFDLTGNALANILYGNGQANVLTGGGGNDVIEGFGGNDTIHGSAQNDYLDGGDGDDMLEGFGGNDTIYGGAGNDDIDGGGGADFMTGGTGDDLYWVEAGDVISEAPGEGEEIVFTRSSYTLTAVADVELMQIGVAGAFALTGNAGANKLYGNNDDNVLTGGGGADVLEGFAGNDTLIGNSVNDFLNGGDGNDLLTGMAGADILLGGAGEDQLAGGSGSNVAYGGTGDDIYWVDNSGDQIFEAPGEGFDVIYTTVSYTLAANAYVEFLQAGPVPVNIALTGNALANTLYGNDHKNLLNGGGGSGADIFEGFGGDDTFNGGMANDYMSGGDGDDTMRASGGNDTLYGGAGNDHLDGGGDADINVGGLGDDFYVIGIAADVVLEAVGEGFDTISTDVDYVLAAGVSVERMQCDPLFTVGDAIDLTGNELASQIFGNHDPNILDGRGGADRFFGGGGKDTYKFTTALGPDNVDAILDFDNSVPTTRDVIALDDAIFAGLTPGALNPANFVTGAPATAPQDGNDYIIYDPATGILYYDSDGSGSTAAIQFANFDTDRPILTAADFIVI